MNSQLKNLNEDCLENCKKLEKFYLYQTKISAIPNFLENAPNLKIISLHTNKI